MFAAKTNKKSKYLKITLIVIVALFVVFVIFRQMSVQNQEQAKAKVDIQPKNEMATISEDDQKRIKKLLQDDTNIKSNKIKDELVLKPKEEVTKEESQTATITSNEQSNSEVSKTSNTTQNIDETQVETSATNITSNNTNENSSQSKIKDAFEDIPEKIEPVQKTILQPKQEVSLIKEPFKSTSLDVDMSFINDIADLKLVKNDISIMNGKFEYKNRLFNVGDYFGVFEIITIEDQKIRFKKSEHFFYNLRFY